MGSDQITQEDLHARRLQSCVEQWPEAESGSYNPACCRFPKSCSPHGYIEAVLAGNLTDKDLEPMDEQPVAKKAAYVEITMKSGAVIKAEVDAFTVQKRQTGGLAGLRWENPENVRSSLMYIDVDDISAIIFNEGDL